MALPRQMRSDQARMRSERMGVSGARAMSAPPAPTVPGAARARVAPETLEMAMGMLGPPRPTTPTQMPGPGGQVLPSPGVGQQAEPMRIQGGPQFSMVDDDRNNTAGQSIDPGFGYALPGAGGPVNFPNFTAPGGTDVRDGTDYSGGQSPWTSPLDEALGMADVAATDMDPGPVSIDDLANQSNGDLYQLLLDAIQEGGRDVEGEQAALAAQMEQAQRQGLVDTRAGFAAMGGGASGALAGIEGDLGQQGAIDQALAMSGIENAARQEQIAKVGSLVSSFGGLEKVSADQKELDLILQLLGEDDGSTDTGTAGELGGGIAQDLAQTGADFTTGGQQGFSANDPLPPHTVIESSGYRRVGPSGTPGVSIWTTATGARVYVMDGGENYSGDGDGFDLNPFDPDF